MMTFEFTKDELSSWTPTTWAVSKLADAHFDVFNERESTGSRSRRAKLAKALGTIQRAAMYLRASCNPADAAYRES